MNTPQGDNECYPAGRGGDSQVIKRALAYGKVWRSPFFLYSIVLGNENI